MKKLDKDNLLKKLQKTLDKEQRKMDKKDSECEKDPELSQDSEYFADYENLRGFIEGLQYAIATVKETRL